MSLALQLRSLFFLLLASSLLPAETSKAEEMLAKALQIGDLETLETLLASGLDPNLHDSHGQTPLFLALTSNQFPPVDLLLRWHADPNGRLKSGRDNGMFAITPLQFAAQMGNVRAAARLIAAGADVNATGIAGRTPLHFAGGRQLSMMQLLIEKGADVNARDAEGASPLDDAVWAGSLDGAAILLAHGARLDEPDKQTGATPLNEAAFRGHADIVRYLLRFHPDPDLPDKRGLTPLDNAIRMGKEDAALLLLEAEPRERQTAAFFQKTLTGAIAKNEPAVIDALLERGAPVDAVLASGATPLGDAASNGSLEAVRALLNHHADPNASSAAGSPLENAALKGFTSIIALLLDHGAQVNHINNASGTTALYAAASFGKEDTVKLLLDHGADASLCGRNAKTPFQASSANGFTSIAALILNHGGSRTCKP